MLYLFDNAFSAIPLKISNLYNKDPKIFAFILLVYNTVFFPICHVEAVQDDISPKTGGDAGGTVPTDGGGWNISSSSSHLHPFTSALIDVF